MSDAIVGADSVVGFGVRGYGYGYDRGRDHIADLLNQGFRADATRDVLEAIRNEGRDNATQFAALGVQSERVAAATNLNVEKTAAAINLNIEKVSAAGVLEATKNAAASQLEAAKNAAAIAAQVAECCCEVKQLIQSEHCTTRALINEVEARHVRDALADAKQALMVAEIKAK